MTWISNPIQWIELLVQEELDSDNEDAAMVLELIREEEASTAHLEEVQGNSVASTPSGSATTGKSRRREMWGSCCQATPGKSTNCSSSDWIWLSKLTLILLEVDKHGHCRRG